MIGELESGGRSTTRRKLPLAVGGLTLALTLGARSARAETIDVYLCAGRVTQAMPDGRDVPMWGYSLVAAPADLAPGCGQTATVPGPVLGLPPHAGPESPTTLNIHLYNDGIAEGVSVVVPGQITSLAPVRNADGRVRSFAAEALTGTVTTYTWSNFKPGTYAYHSGSHPAVQVQMGLYGAIKQDVAPGVAYAGVEYEHEVVLVYSEVDPELHDAVDQGSYGAPPFTSTIDYAPRYYLVNGQAHTGPSTARVAAGRAGEPTLLRLLNLGLETHAPLLMGAHVAVVAEDGNPYPHAREHYSVLLPAAKARDALWVPDAAGVYALFDRRLRLDNAPGVVGGMFSELDVAAGSESAEPTLGGAP